MPALSGPVRSSALLGALCHLLLREPSSTDTYSFLPPINAGMLVAAFLAGIAAGEG